MGKITSGSEDTIPVVSIKGTVDVWEIIDYISEHLKSWLNSPVLWDLSEMEFQNISGDDVRVFTQRIKEATEKREGMKTALVGSKDIQFGMLRALMMYGENYQLKTRIKVFRTKEEARKWLLETESK